MISYHDTLKFQVSLYVRESLKAKDRAGMRSQACQGVNETHSLCNIMCDTHNIWRHRSDNPVSLMSHFQLTEVRLSGTFMDTGRALTLVQRTFQGRSESNHMMIGTVSGISREHILSLE